MASSSAYMPSCRRITISWKRRNPPLPGIDCLGLTPQQVCHGIEFRKGAISQRRVAAVEHHPAVARLEQAPPQGLLQKAQPEACGSISRLAVPQPVARPRAFDQPNPVNHHAVVAPVRASVERQAQDSGCLFAGRQQQPVMAKVLEPDRLASEAIEQPRQRRDGGQLARQQVMALEPGIVPGSAQAVYRAKWQGVTLRNRTAAARV